MGALRLSPGLRRDRRWIDRAHVAPLRHAARVLYGCAREFADEDAGRRTPSTSRFLDSIRLQCEAGSGGPGAVSYRKHSGWKSLGPGRPEGSTGGRGGDVALVARAAVRGFGPALAAFAGLRPHQWDAAYRGEFVPVRAPDGEPGRAGFLHGRAGDPVEIPVPIGTLVSEFELGDDDVFTEASLLAPAAEPAAPAAALAAPEVNDGGKASFLAKRAPAAPPPEASPTALTPAVSPPADGDAVRLVPLARLTREGERFLACYGGVGGRGNSRERPHASVTGVPGDKRYLELSLEYLADVALVGLPNAGKSTLFGQITGTAAGCSCEPFFTQFPQVARAGGVCRGGSPVPAFSLADLPGLDACPGRRVESRLLGHIARTKALLLVIDAANEAVPPLDAFFHLRRCLEAGAGGGAGGVGGFGGGGFSSALAAAIAPKPFAVVANKCDVAPARALPLVDGLAEAAREAYPERDVRVVAASGRASCGIDNIRRACSELLAR